MTRRDIVQHLRILVQRRIHKTNGTSLAGSDAFVNNAVEECCDDGR
jgi:hypothetical protein